MKHHVWSNCTFTTTSCVRMIVLEKNLFNNKYVRTRSRLSKFCIILYSLEGRWKERNINSRASIRKSCSILTVRRDTCFAVCWIWFSKLNYVGEICCREIEYRFQVQPTKRRIELQDGEIVSVVNIIMISTGIMCKISFICINTVN